jgi:Uma2 family endonuclease
MDTTQTIYREPPILRRWRREEYDKAAEAGIFGAEERLELIEGEIIPKLAPQNSPHAASISLCSEALRQALTGNFHIRVQLPLAIGEWNEPEPDIAVVAGSARDYEENHPTTALLAVEVSDSTIRLDRDIKSQVYASAQIAEYWILNLGARTLEVYSHPLLDPDAGRYMYSTVTNSSEDEAVTPLAAPHSLIRVADLLPRKRL